MENPEKLTTSHKTKTNKQKQMWHTMCWTPLYTNKHK